jgi:hypothetical protein
VIYRGYHIRESKDNGGKAGRGNNLTASIQVQDRKSALTGYFLPKSISYRLDVPTARAKAIQKAKDFVDKELFDTTSI